jgi:predicted O-methyltransferase YrrM
VEAVIEQLLGIGPDERIALEDRVRLPGTEVQDRGFSSREPLLRIVGATVLHRRPDHVLETGVQRGNTSSVLLHAMREVGNGRLVSIDLPGVRGAPVVTGELVAPELRDRWDLRMGPSRKLLPVAAAELDPVDLSIHDADHSYQAQVDEFRQVWPHLAPGGLLVCDDVWTPSILDFADEVNVTPMLVRRGDSDAVGIVVHP